MKRKSQKINLSLILFWGLSLSACHQHGSESSDRNEVIDASLSQRVTYPLTLKYALENGVKGEQVIKEFYPSYPEVNCEQTNFMLQVFVKEGEFGVLEQTVDDNDFTDYAVDAINGYVNDGVEDTQGYASVTYEILNETDHSILSKAKDLHDAEKYNQAMDTLEQISEGSLNEVCVLFLKAKIKNELEDFEASIVFLNQALEKSPMNDNLLYSRAHRYNKLGKTSLALADLEKSKTIEPGHWETYYLFNKIYSDTEDYVAAIKYASLGLDYRDDEYFYNMRGWDYYNNDNYELAVLDFEQAIEINPEDANSFNGLAATLNEQGLFNEAITNIEAAIELDGNSTFRFNELGSNYDELDNLKQAEKYFRDAIASGEATSTTYNNLGWAFIHRKQFQSAIDVYQEAIEQEVTSEILLNNLGTAYLKSGQYKKAAENFKNVLSEFSHDDGNEFSYAGLAKAQIHLGELDNALLNIQEILKRDVDYVDGLYQKWGLTSSPFLDVILQLEEASKKAGKIKIIKTLGVIREQLK